MEFKEVIGDLESNLRIIGVDPCKYDEPGPIFVVGRLDENGSVFGELLSFYFEELSHLFTQFDSELRNV